MTDELGNEPVTGPADGLVAKAEFGVDDRTDPLLEAGPLYGRVQSTSLYKLLSTSFDNLAIAASWVAADAKGDAAGTNVGETGAAVAAGAVIAGAPTKSVLSLRAAELFRAGASS